MTTIDPSSQLLAAIRAQALAWRRRDVTRGGASGAEEPPTTSAGGVQDWMAQVARSVVAIAPDDPQRQRRAFRIYLQAALARECGIRRVEDPGFQDLVDRVQSTMESDSQLRKAIDTAGRLLLETAAG